MRRAILAACTLLLLGALATAPASGATASGATASGATASGATESVAFSASADTYVNASAPTSSYGTGQSLYVDAEPQKQTLLRFDVSSLHPEDVQRASLRLYQKGTSRSGGRVFAVSPSWSESTTWKSRPALTSAQLGEFGAVEPDRWYDASLSSLPLVEGVVSLALDSLYVDGARWASRESGMRPTLVVDVAAAPAADGVSTVADSLTGSSDPTYYGNNRRMAVTNGARLLAVHGRHRRGVQLAWRDPAGGWQTTTRGSITDGLLLGDAGTGDRPASIAVARDATGAEHAWVVFAGYKANGVSVQLRRISELDDPRGPTVGPLVTVAAGEQGAFRPDVAFEHAPDAVRGVVTYTMKMNSGGYAVVATWFTDLTSSAPTFSATTTLFTTSSSSRGGTLVATPAGMWLVAKGSSSALQAFVHDAGTPLDRWRTGVAGVKTQSAGTHSAIALQSRQVLAVAETSVTDHVVTVQRFTADADSASVDLRLTGYTQPSIATSGTSAWVVAIRVSDGAVVSRRFDPENGWAGTDHVELGPEGGGNYAWPNVLLATPGRLHFIVRGPAGGTYTSAVLAVSRPL